MNIDDKIKPIVDDPCLPSAYFQCLVREIQTFGIRQLVQALSLQSLPPANPNPPRFLRLETSQILTERNMLVARGNERLRLYRT